MMEDGVGAVAREMVEEEAVDRLPEWRLTDLYDAPDDVAIDADLLAAKQAAQAFKTTYAGRLAALSGAELGRAISDYEKIVERLYRVSSFAQLRFAADVSDAARGRFLQMIQERFNEISALTLFFGLELNRIDDAVIETQLGDPACGHYRPWIRETRAYRPHQLSDELEEFVHDLSVVGISAWTRLFDQTIAELRLTVGDRELTIADTLNLFDNPNRTVRHDAAHALGEGLSRKGTVFTLILNTLAKDKEIDDKWRRYPHPVAYRNLANQVEDDVVDALVSAIRDAYDLLAHRYYRLKARWFGQEHLDYWDRNAPLPGDDDRRYRWDEARAIVLAAYGGFDPRMAEIAGEFFERHWIDAEPRPGKDPGAFCHPTVPSVHPYVLMSYYGRSRDITTLAHELGHGVHQTLAAKQGALMSSTPLTLAETASVFGEMLVFRALLEREHDRERRRRLLAGKVENMLNTVVRQVAFHQFEKMVHEERRRGELSTEAIGDVWMQVQQESLGPVVRFDDAYRHYWSYIPHFIHSPFYVYAYAFGDCLVNSLYRVYCDGAPGFPDKYFDMLRAGGTLRHRELLQPFGLDASDPTFWRRGLDVIVGFIDELEQLG